MAPLNGAHFITQIGCDLIPGVGRLEQSRSKRVCYLEPEHLVGRADFCALRLGQTYVSSQHALLRWNEGSWELIDRGSRNGTWADGVQLNPGKPHRLQRGATIAFGHLEETWVLKEASEPSVFVVDLARETYLLGRDGVIGIPSAETPSCTVYRDRDGVWKLELPDQPLVPLRSGAQFGCDGRDYRFCSPAPVSSTAAAENPQLDQSVTLHFIVSSDEEYVELRALRGATEVIELGARGHNYLLLTLARARVADHARSLPEGGCGWVDKDQLSLGLRMSAAQLDLEVFRIRKHFANHHLEAAASVIERRPRTKQLRLGVNSVRITRR